MKFVHCPHCGKKLTKKEIGDEGMVPFCTSCQVPVFDLPYTCTITLVVNEFGEAALIRQGYVSQDTHVCVAGYIKAGESAEETAAREVKEEIGLDVNEISYLRSYYYEKRDMLMLGFVAKVKKEEFILSVEVDEAEWFSTEEAVTKVSQGSIAAQLIIDYMQYAKGK